MRKGDLVLIEFKDHCSAVSGLAEVVNCKVVGWVLDETPHTITVCSWVAEVNPVENNDTYALIKHKGMRIKRLKAA